MKNFSPTQNLIYAIMIIGLILSVWSGDSRFESIQSILRERIREFSKFLPLNSSKKLHKKIKANPKMTATEVTAFANSSA